MEGEEEYNKRRKWLVVTHYIRFGWLGIFRDLSGFLYEKNKSPESIEG